MAIDGIKITKSDIEELNRQGGIYQTRNDMNNNNSVDVNPVYFGDNGDMYIDSQGRIIEQQEDGSEVYMGWTNSNKAKNLNKNTTNNSKQPNINSADDYKKYFNIEDKKTTANKATNTNATHQPNINSADDYRKHFNINNSTNNTSNTKDTFSDYINKVPNKNAAYADMKNSNNTNNGSFTEYLNKVPNKNAAYTDLKNSNNNKSISDYLGKVPTKDAAYLQMNKSNSEEIKPIKQSTAATNTKVYDAPIYVDRSAIDNKNTTKVYDAPIYVDRSAIDNKNTTKVYDAPINVDRSAIDNKNTTKVYDAPIYVDRSAINNNTTNSSINNTSINNNNGNIEKIKTTTNSNVTENLKDLNKIEKTNLRPNNKVNIQNTNTNQPTTNKTQQTTNATQQTTNATQQTTNANLGNDKNSSLANDTLYEINRIRRENNLPDLEWSDELAQAANVRAQEASQKWSHTRPNGQKYYTVSNEIKGENLAKNYSDANSAVEAWMNSDRHRANLLDKDLKSIGISIIDTEDGQNFFAADFGETIPVNNNVPNPGESFYEYSQRTKNNIGNTSNK